VTVRSRALLPAILLAAPVWLMAAAFARQAATVPDVIAVRASRPGADIAPATFGVFFEDINFAADGGLYSERIKNRSFEFDEPLAGRARRFISDGELAVSTDRPLNSGNPHYLRVGVHSPGNVSFVSNAGFRGIGVQAGAEYLVSVYARTVGPGPQSVRVTLNDERGSLLGQASLGGLTNEWARYEATVTPAAATARAQFQVIIDQAGDVDLDMVSFFPKDTWNNRRNGVRKDLVQLLKRSPCAS
jgi:alpha-N-arabinofuranosidase